MREHIAAVEALLAPLGRKVYYVDADENPVPPYVLLWSSSGVAPAEVSVAGSPDLTDQLGVTCVAGTPYGVLTLRQQVRDALDGAAPVVPGRVVRLDLTDSRPTAVDRDVDPHVPYGVDLYLLVSVPA